MALLTLATTACGPTAPDYQSIISATGATTTTSAAAVPFSQYLESIGVVGQPQSPQRLDGITVTMGVPDGWRRVAHQMGVGVDVYRPIGAAQSPVATQYPSAMVMAFKLHGAFDITAVIKQANASAYLSPEFSRITESFADFGGFPSAAIEGTHDDPEGVRLRTINRVVIPVTAAPHFQRYLIQFTVTTAAARPTEQDDAVAQIVSGFSVSAT